MRKYLIAGAAALTLMSGAALADSTTTTTITSPAVITPVESSTSVTTTNDPITGQVSRSQTEHIVDSMGREVNKSTSLNESAGHVDRATSSSVKNPDGSTVTTRHEEWSNQAPVTSSTTTTTTNSISQ